MPRSVYPDIIAEFLSDVDADFKLVSFVNFEREWNLVSLV
jgi:hypothetical protein